LIQKEWFSVVDVDVTDDYLERRQKAVSAIATKWRRPFSETVALKRAEEIAQALTKMTEGSLPDSLRADVVQIIRDKALTFEDTDSATLEIRVCTAAALSDYLEKPAQIDAAPTFTDALVTATEFVAPPVDAALIALWSQIMRQLAAETEEDAQYARQRLDTDTSDPERAVARLAKNAKLDREEINILWWALNDWSVLAGARFSSLTPAAHVVLAPLELASLMTVPAGEAHRDLAFRNLTKPTAEVGLKDIANLDNLKVQVANALAAAETLVVSHPRVFPVVRALLAGTSEDAEAAWNELGLDAEVKKPAAHWAAVLMRELSLLGRLDVTVRREHVNAG
jgi:hypothetical protein